MIEAKEFLSIAVALSARERGRKATNLNTRPRNSSAVRSIQSTHRFSSRGTTFSQLSPADKDAYLEKLEKGELDLDGVPSNISFDFLWKHTQEGFFADLIYATLARIDCCRPPRWNIHPHDLKPLRQHPAGAVDLELQPLSGYPS